MGPCYLDLRREFDRQSLIDITATKKRVVVIAGPGISTNAGILSLCNLSRKELFHISVFKSDPSTVSAFTSMIHDLSKQIATAKATLFHRQLAELAKCGRLLRLFTENIDCLEDQEESLRSTITVPLHGRLDKVRCDRCQWTEALSPKHFEGPELTPCTHCRDPAREGLRQRLAGKLRPDVVYYGEDNPNAELIDSAVEEVFIECPDIVIVAGTRLETADARSITKRLCRLARDKGGVTIWVHLEKPSASCCMLPLLDYIILGDCDEFATFLSPRNGSGGHNEALDRVGLNIAREHIDSVEIAGKQGIKRKLPSLNSTHQQDIEAHELRPRLKRVRGTGKVDLPDNYSSHPAKNSDKSNTDAAVFEIGRATDNTNGTMLSAVKGATLCVMNNRNRFKELLQWNDFFLHVLIKIQMPWHEIRHMSAIFIPPTVEHAVMMEIIHIAITDTSRAEELLYRLPCLPQCGNFGDRIQEFKRLSRPYLHMFSVDCSFEVTTTTQYGSKLEATIIARKTIQEGEIVTYGVAVPITPLELANLHRTGKDFSIMESSKGLLYWLAGPPSFANHGCDPDAELVVSIAKCDLGAATGRVVQIIARRKIEPGGKITVAYGGKYFGKGENGCRCTDCEILGRNGWATLPPTKIISHEERGIRTRSVTKKWFTAGLRIFSNAAEEKLNSLICENCKLLFKDTNPMSECPPCATNLSIYGARRPNRVPLATECRRPFGNV